jgi:hypothetical protein
MPEMCHRCGGELPAGSGESPFCPHCGTPQLFLALENQSVETGGEPAIAADGKPSTGTLPPPRPQQVEWKTAIRCAVLVAGIGSVLRLASLQVGVLSAVSLLWIVSASLITLGLYQKRQPAAWIDARVGMRIGLVVGLCLAIGFSATVAGWTLVVRYGLHSGSFDSQRAAEFAEAQGMAQQWMTAHSMPVAPEMVALEKTPEYRAWYELCGAAFGAACLLVLSAVGGAFAGLLRTRRGPAV